MGSFTKDCLQPLVWTGFQSKRWRSSLRYLPSCISTCSSKRRDLTRK